MVLGQLSQRNIAPTNPNSNANPKPTQTRGQFSSGWIVQTPIYINIYSNFYKLSLHNFISYIFAFLTLSKKMYIKLQ